MFDFAKVIQSITFLGLLVFGWIYYQDREADKKQELKDYSELLGMSLAYEQLTKDVGQLSSSYRDQTFMLAALQDNWREVQLGKNEVVKVATTTKVSVPAVSQIQTASDFTDKVKGFIVNELRINGPDSPPIGFVLIKDSGEVQKQNYQFELKLETVQLRDQVTGKVRVVSKVFLVPQENGLAADKRPDLKKWTGEKYPLPVVGGEALVDPTEKIAQAPEPKRLLPWTMNFNAAALATLRANGVGQKVGLDVNLGGYGVTKQDLDWKFLHLGVNYDSVAGFGVHLQPFTYRPLRDVLTNTYVGPGYYKDSEQQGYFIGVNVGL